jgi:hypothetical protein
VTEPFQVSTVRTAQHRFWGQELHDGQLQPSLIGRWTLSLRDYSEPLCAVANALLALPI